MSGEWGTVKLGDVLTLQRGFDLPERLRRPGTVPIVSSAGPSGTHADGKVKGPGVVTGRYGTIGQVFWVEGEYWPLNTTLWVSDFKGNDPRYCYYLLRTIDFETCSDKAAVPGVNRNDLHELEVVLAPRELQPRLAEILAALDDKIDLNRRMNRTLEAAAAALFKSWFVDFDPVVAKAEGRRPFGMTDDVAKLFPSRFVNSELGPIPEGWRYSRLAAVADLNPARTIPKGAWAPYVEMASLPTCGHRASEWPLREAGSGARFMNGDTLFARITPCLENGKTGYVDFLGAGEVAWGSTEYIVVRPRSPFPTEWGYLMARNSEFREFAVQKMEGTSGRQRVSADSIRDYLVATPPPPVVEAFGQGVRPLFHQMTATSNESGALAALRDSLLPRLLSGELELKTAERAVARAV